MPIALIILAILAIGCIVFWSCKSIRAKRLARFNKLKNTLLSKDSIGINTAEDLLLEYEALNKFSWLNKEILYNPAIEKALINVLANAAKPILTGTISENMEVLIGALKTNRFKQTGKVALFTGDLTFEVVDLLFKDKMFDFGILKALESASDLPIDTDAEHFVLDEYTSLFRFSEISTRAPLSFAGAVLLLTSDLDVLISEFSELQHAKKTISEWIARGGKPAEVVLQ